MNDPWEQARGYVDVALAKAMSHPLRVHILEVLNKTVMSPSRYSKRFEVPLSTASHHFRALEEAGCIKIVAEVQRGGAVEHFYIATRTALFDDEAWGQLPETIRNKVSGRAATGLIEAIAEAMLEETFDAQIDRILAWQQLHLDAQAWNEAVEINRRATEELLEVKAHARSRLIRSGERGRMATWAQLLFESPFPQTDSPEAL